MAARIDLTSQRFGRWTVRSYAGKSRWLCCCDCGTEKEVSGSSLRRGATNGCIRCHPGRGNRRSHGQSKTRLYNIWTGMIDRCENKKSQAYQRYGARGILLCSEWRKSFPEFRNWALGNGYADTLTIDRKDNDHGYCPVNCRWVTYAEQNRNYSRNRPVEFRGESVLVCDLAAEFDLPQDIVKNRIFRYGWSVEEAVSTPVLRKGQRRIAAHRQSVDAFLKQREAA